MCVFEMKTSQNFSMQQHELRFSQGVHKLVPIVFNTATAWYYFLLSIFSSCHQVQKTGSTLISSQLTAPLSFWMMRKWLMHSSWHCHALLVCMYSPDILLDQEEFFTCGCNLQLRCPMNVMCVLEIKPFKTLARNNSNSCFHKVFTIQCQSPIVFNTATAWNYFLSIIISSNANDRQHFNQQSAH